MEPGIERVQALPDISHWSYVVTVMKPMHRLQICPIMHHNGAPPTIPPSYIRVRAAVWECGKGQTDTKTAVTNIHFVLATPHVKCNKNINNMNVHSNAKSRNK